MSDAGVQADGIDAQPPGGMSWGLGSFLFERAFGELASGLKWMFWGLTLQLAGGGLLLLGLALAGLKLPPQGLMLLLPVALISLGVGGLVVLWGEQKCLHLKLPLGMTHSLPGHRWLRAAYACHLAGLLSRLGRGLLPRNVRKWAAVITLPAQALGFVFLLLFLRKLADVIVRRDLQRLIDWIFALVATTAVLGAVLATARQWNPALPKQLLLPLLLGALAIALVSFLGAMASYLVLLWRMATAVEGFARFLATEPEEVEA